MTAPQPSPRDRLAGGLVGLLVGDALGVPYEFRQACDIPPTGLIDFTPPPSFDRAHVAVAPGTWSDDGAHALCLLASLLECGCLDLDDLGARLLAWYEQGYMAVDGMVFDVGLTCGAAIRALRAGTPVAQAGPSGQYDNGNGSLMRALPLASAFQHTTTLTQRPAAPGMVSGMCVRMGSGLRFGHDLGNG